MNLNRLLRPRSIAVYGGRWSDYVAEQCLKLGFDGELWRVHPHREGCFRGTADLPGAPDSAFLGINRDEAITEVDRLKQLGAGGAVVFAAGFNEVEDGKDRAAELGRVARDMPFLGPNCYGFANFFDSLSLWPDQAIGRRRERGVAILGQSGTVSISLMYQRRSLPLGYVITMGNQQAVGCADLIRFAAGDDRVSAIGMYLETIGDARQFVDAVDYAKQKGKPIAVIKVGRSEKSRQTAFSHTGSLTGSDQLIDELFSRLGIARCESLAELVETLKLFHCFGPAKSNRLSVMGASGGDMAMVSDIARHHDIDFALPPAQEIPQLEASTGPDVVIDNPFDFHTYTWFDSEKMSDMFGAMLRSNYDLTAFMLDPPNENEADPHSFDVAVDAFIEAVGNNPAPAALVSSLPDNLSTYNHDKCLSSGIVPLQGLPEFVAAFNHSSRTGKAWAKWAPPSVHAYSIENSSKLLDEPNGKSLLKKHGIAIPRGEVVPIEHAAAAAERLGFPVVVKTTGKNIVHKSDVGGVAVNLNTAEAVQEAASQMKPLGDHVLVEEMVTDAAVELILGVTVDAGLGPAITVGAGGVLTELLKDTACLLPPLDRDDIVQALGKLRIARLFGGYRGKPAVDINPVVDTILSLESLVTNHHQELIELDINPLLVRPQGVVAADALIRLTGDTHV